MGKTLNAITVVFLMLVSGYVGYKIGDFQLGDILNKKLKEEIERSKKTLEQAQQIHIQEINKINEDYDKRIAVAKSASDREKQELETIISNKDKSIATLEEAIMAKEREIDAAHNERLTLSTTISELESRIKVQDKGSTTDKDRLVVLKNELRKKEEQIRDFQKKKSNAEEEIAGRKCLDKFVPTLKGEKL